MLMNYGIIISIIADNINNTESITTEVLSCSTMIHHSTSVSPERILNSPIKTRLREVHANEIKSLKRKLHLQNYNHKKMQTKLQSLKNVIKDLQKRNLITPDEGDILQHLEKGTKELIKRELRKKQNLPVSKMYKDSLRQFALTLHYYSPKAYNYVCYKFYNSAASKNSI